MNFILTVEYESEEIILRVTNQFEIESTIMEENTTRFKLACSSPLFKYEILNKSEGMDRIEKLKTYYGIIL